MKIKTLSLKNFRNCKSRVFDFESDRVLLIGANGSGKSNILESLGFLSILRSFRGALSREMVMIGEREFIISGEMDGARWNRKLALRETPGKKRELFENSNPVRRSSEFISNFRTVIFAPEDRFIISGGASFRRRFFDMLISVLEVEYFSALGSCNQALKQRNKALKDGGKGADYFVPELVSTTRIIDDFRKRYAEMVEKEVNILLDTRAKFGIRCNFSAPDSDEKFMKLLFCEREKELRRGTTLYGPHLDEFEFTLDDKPLRYCGSNGEIRMISIFLKMAEFSIIRRRAELPVLILADDVTGELDSANRERFFELTRVADQAFFTFTSVPKEDFFKDSQVVSAGVL